MCFVFLGHAVIHLFVLGLVEVQSLAANLFPIFIIPLSAVSLENAELFFPLL